MSNLARQQTGHVGSLDNAIRDIEGKVDNFRGFYPSEALEIGNELQLLKKAVFNYQKTTEDTHADFFECRQASRSVSKAITGLRMSLLECFQTAPESGRHYFSELLDKTLVSLWDPHIRHDMDTYSEQQLSMMCDSVLKIVRAFEDCLGHISDKTSELEETANKNENTLSELKGRLSLVRPAPGQYYSPVILKANGRNRNQRKKPHLRIVK